MATLTQATLKAVRDTLRNCIVELERENREALDEGRISAEQFRHVNGEQLSLENRLNRLNVLLVTVAFDSITLGDNSSGAKISIATDKLNTAISKLEDLKNFLNTVADVLNGLNDVIAAIGSVELVK
jgi:hypothetical protein